MQQSLENIFRLGIKELYSLARDPVLLFLIGFVFIVAVHTVATNVKTELKDASIAIVDEDDSDLSRAIRNAFLKPYFKAPTRIDIEEIDPAMDDGRYVFVLDIPPNFQAEVLAGRKPIVQLMVDATAMTLAGNGAAYIRAIFDRELAAFASRGNPNVVQPVTLDIRTKFNPNLESSWFMAVMQIITNVTLLSMILTGAAVIRERERGTIEHLLVMPVTAFEIMMAKIWANGLAIILAVTLSMYVIVKGVIGVKISGSITLFLFGTAVYLYAMTALGIALSTFAKTMPQFGLLTIPFFIVMIMLSGGTSPQENMPRMLQIVMQTAPSTHYTRFVQDVLYRGAGLDIVWPHLLLMAFIGSVLFVIALARFRATMSSTR